MLEFKETFIDKLRRLCEEHGHEVEFNMDSQIYEVRWKPRTPSSVADFVHGED